MRVKDQSRLIPERAPALCCGAEDSAPRWFGRGRALAPVLVQPRLKDQMRALRRPRNLCGVIGVGGMLGVVDFGAGEFAGKAVIDIAVVGLVGAHN